MLDSRLRQLQDQDVGVRYNGIREASEINCESLTSWTDKSLAVTVRIEKAILPRLQLQPRVEGFFLHFHDKSLSLSLSLFSYCVDIYRFYRPTPIIITQIFGNPSAVYCFIFLSYTFSDRVNEGQLDKNWGRKKKKKKQQKNKKNNKCQMISFIISGCWYLEQEWSRQPFKNWMFSWKAHISICWIKN